MLKKSKFRHRSSENEVVKVGGQVVFGTEEETVRRRRVGALRNIKVYDWASRFFRITGNLLGFIANNFFGLRSYKYY